MRPVNIAQESPLDDLVRKVYHLELSECKTFAEFKEGLRLMLHNLDAVLQALACYVPPTRRIQRAADLLKLKAVRLRSFCLEAPELDNGSQEWRQVARNIIVNYEQFRIDAGMLYQLVVPGSSFSVLRAAL